MAGAVLDDLTQELAGLSALSGLLRHAEGVHLARLASAVPAEHAIVEVGAFRGKATAYLAAGAERGEGAHVYAVDPWDLGAPAAYPRQPRKAARFAAAEVRERFAAQTAAWADRITPIRGYSAEVAAGWRGPVGLLWIDGDHRAAAVIADVMSWGRHVVEGGRLAVHDYAPTHPGVVRAVDTTISRSGEWAFEALVERVWTARRL